MFNSASFLEPLERSKIPKLFVLGDSDSFCSVTGLKSFVDSLEEGTADFKVVEGADHFWFGNEDLIVDIFEMAFFEIKMKVVALVSGGKDSTFNQLHCLANGHEIVALANLHPKVEANDELDSFMFQTVGHDVITLYAECTGLPLFRREINGSSVVVGSDYIPEDTDEVEDLMALLMNVKEKIPDIEGVAVGAILSNYQRVRVENVCNRLGLTSLAYLWRQNQQELMENMISAGIEAIIVKVAAMGLSEKHLGKSLQKILPTLMRL
ncbi:hypothetical protein HK096_008840, partial [Nowakowskiella sp. JEL0078]